MLKNLHVENFALIDKIDVEFEPGLTIITGETGAGKSILIDALGSTIGEKIDADSLRKGARRAVAEGIFQIGDDAEILRKEISDTLRNRAFVNDSPVRNSLLTEIGNHLVDLHGQHEHQSLLNVNYHIQYLDEFGGYGSLLLSVEENYNRFLKLVEEFNTLKAREQTLSEKRDVYQFQIAEIKSISPVRGEDQPGTGRRRTISSGGKDPP